MNITQRNGQSWNLELTPTGSALVMFVKDDSYVIPTAPFTHAHTIARRRRNSGCEAFRPVVMVHVLGGRLVHIFHAPTYFEGMSDDAVLEQIHAAITSLDDETQLGIGNCIWSPQWTVTKSISKSLAQPAALGSPWPVLTRLD